MTQTYLNLSVIIPARNEASLIGRTLDALFDGACYSPPELIVVDGGSRDATREVARSAGAKVLSTGPGRAKQMNYGAESARGDHLLFLHADTLVPKGYDRHINHVLASPDTACGAFRLHIDSPGAVYRWIQRGVNLRSRLRSLPYGDQGLFMRAIDFRQIGGFPDIPVMEDYEMVRRLRKRGQVRLAPACVQTSARRWLRHGLLCATLTNQMCIIGYHLGVSPRRLARWRDDRCAKWTAKNGTIHDAGSDHGSGRADRAGAADTSGK